MKTFNFLLDIKRLALLFLLLYLFIPQNTFGQEGAFQPGEKLKLRIHYGWFNASYATLEVRDKKIGDTNIYHVRGHGKSTGVLHAFFKVNDTYQSYIDTETLLPIQFFRDIDEGGYKKNKIIWFNQNARSAKVRDLKHDTEETYSTEPEVQDMISAFYYIRNQIDTHLKNEGDELTINMFFDENNYQFKTVLVGKETLKTKFGKIKTLKLRPYVQEGRVFKEKESLTVWISDDDNKIPVKLKAKLAVGSLTADLEEYEGLKYPIEFE